MASANPVLRAVDAPPSIHVKSKLPSLSKAVTRMYFSEDVSIPVSLQGKVKVGVDLVQLEVDKVRALLKDSGSAADKKITYVRYTSGDMRLANALIDAWQAGIPVEIYIDLNPVLAPEVDQGGSPTNDFSRLKARSEDSPGYQAYKAFLAAGMQMGKNLFSQPIYNPGEDERTPIFHEKAMVLERTGKVSEVLISSANAAPNPRVNRTLEFRDADLAAYYMDHVADLRRIFSSDSPKAIRELPERAPLKIEYGDGSTLKMAFTDGKYNPNDNIVNALRTLHLKRITMSHFAFTYGKMADALAENLEIISPNAKTLILLDDRFANLVTWGVGLSLKGIMVPSPPFNGGESRLVFPKPKEVAGRVDMYIYQRPALDEETGKIRPETDEDGPPLARHVNHEKTTVLVDTTGRSYIAFGSLNASGNFHNADLQLEMQIPERDWIAAGFEATINGLVERDKDVFAFSALDATVRNGLGLLTGHTDLGVTLAQAREAQRAFLAEDEKGLEAVLNELLAQPSALQKVAPIGTREIWKSRFLQFAKEYGARLKPEQRTEATLMKVFSIIPVMTDQPLSSYAQKSLVAGLYFGVINSDEERDKQVAADLALFGRPKAEREAKKRPAKPLVARAFDWDNTVMTMPTKIRLFHSDGTNSWDVETEQFAQIRPLLGKEGTEYKDWNFRYPESVIKFQASEEWRDGYFVRDLEAALADPNGRAQAFETFIASLNQSKSADSTYVVTARGHSVQEMIMGLVRLRQIVENEIFQRRGKKVMLHLPPRKNFYLLSKAGDAISEAKAKVIARVAGFELKYRAEKFIFYEDDDKTRNTVEAYLDKIMSDDQRAKTEVVHPKDLAGSQNDSTPDKQKRKRRPKEDCDQDLE